MANVRTAKAGDVMKCSVRGEVFFGEVVEAATQVSPRVYEAVVQRHGAFGQQHRVRGRQVIAVYRKLKS